MTPPCCPDWLPPGCPPAEADGGAAGGGVRGQAEGAEREAGAGEQVICCQRTGGVKGSWAPALLWGP